MEDNFKNREDLVSPENVGGRDYQSEDEGGRARSAVVRAAGPPSGLGPRTRDGKC